MNYYQVINGWYYVVRRHNLLYADRVLRTWVSTHTLILSSFIKVRTLYLTPDKNSPSSTVIELLFYSYICQLHRAFHALPIPFHPLSS
jgi:hypothetical protein